jgi:hypothetical protein
MSTFGRNRCSFVLFCKYQDAIEANDSMTLIRELISETFRKRIIDFLVIISHPFYLDRRFGRNY